MPRVLPSAFTRVYAAFIGDGHLYSIEAHDGGDDDPQVGMAPEGSGYWYSLRHSEVDCPVCHAGDEPPGRVACESCEGTGTHHKGLSAAHEDADDYEECSDCDGKGTVRRDCPECGGSRVTEGEAFTVERADLATADDVAELLEACDLGDGYENAGAWATWLKARGVEPVTVLEWEPERAGQDD